ncbi:MAG TPA: hypothetical protein PLO41_03355 [Rubrivivax sp.]|nr:hypothetical protein [Rubrivivax sp.]
MRRHRIDVASNPRRDRDHAGRGKGALHLALQVVFAAAAGASAPVVLERQAELDARSSFQDFQPARPQPQVIRRVGRGGEQHSQLRFARTRLDKMPRPCRAARQPWLQRGLASAVLARPWRRDRGG